MNAQNCDKLFQQRLEQVKQLVENEGQTHYSDAALAEELGANPAYILRLREALGYPQADQRRRDRVKPQVQEMVSQELHPIADTHMAEILGCSVDVIRSVRRELGVPGWRERWQREKEDGET